MVTKLLRLLLMDAAVVIVINSVVCRISAAVRSPSLSTEKVTYGGRHTLAGGGIDNVVHQSGAVAFGLQIPIHEAAEKTSRRGGGGLQTGRRRR